MKHAIGLIFGAVLAGVAFAEPVVHEVGAFRAIEVQEDVRLNVTMGPAQAVSAVALDGDVSKLRVREFLPWLVFDRNTRWFIFPKWRDDVLEVSVETPVLNGLKAFDGAQATFAGDAGERLWVEAGAGGMVAVTDIEVEELTMVARDGGTINAAGSCNTITIRNEGEMVDASGMTCQSFVVRGDPDGVVLPTGAVVVDEHPASGS